MPKKISESDPMTQETATESSRPRITFADRVIVESKKTAKDYYDARRKHPSQAAQTNEHQAVIDNEKVPAAKPGPKT